MARLVPVSWRELIRRLRLFGFKGPYYGGKHPYMIKVDNSLVIPNRHEGIISVDLLTRILKRAGILRRQWLKLP